MLGLPMLDVAIGVIFVFVLVSILCSAIREGIEGWLKTRATHLEHGIRELLHDPDAKGLALKVFNHPMIYSLYPGGYKPTAKSDALWRTGGGNLPSYVPSRNFALALMDLAARGPVGEGTAADGTASPPAGTLSLAAIRANIQNIGDSKVQRVLLTAIDTAQNDLDRAIANVEAWYDTGMDRVSGWYKRSTQWILFVIGLTVAIVLNINAITVTTYLFTNEAARETLVAQAQTAAGNPDLSKIAYAEAKQRLAETKLPIGWSDGWPLRNDANGTARAPASAFEFWNYVVMPILGWLITALAATLGAPFWFDLLNKVMVIRSTVKPHEKSPEESSEDRQTETDKAKRPSSPA